MPSVLLVEDHAPMRATLRMWLADLVSQITECDNGTEVCACYARYQPDWVLMDIELPGQDGIAATRELLTKNPGAQVLMVTGYQDADMQRAATAAGARGYVLKENLPELRQWFESLNTNETTNLTNLPVAEKGKIQ